MGDSSELLEGTRQPLRLENPTQEGEQFVSTPWCSLRTATRGHCVPRRRQKARAAYGLLCTPIPRAAHPPARPLGGEGLCPE